MKVIFWGTRGSLPAPLIASEFRSKARNLLLHAGLGDCTETGSPDMYLNGSPIPRAMTFGGNTPCVEMSEGGRFIVFDCGSGMRLLGRDIMRRGLPKGSIIDIFQTHTHWDHIMGFPFFAPALAGGYHINIHGVHPNLRGRFEAQMDRVHFPITLDDLKSPVEFHQIKSGDDVEIGPFTVSHKGLHHPGGSYAYRVAAGGKSAVFATDAEYTNGTEENLKQYVDFYRGADMFIFDAMYATLEMTIEKMNYGHSTAVIGVDLALSAEVKTLVLFHHDPESDDDQIAESYYHAREYLDTRKAAFSSNTLQLVTSYDGLELAV